MLTLKWLTCGQDNHWCSLAALNLNGATESGVYIIWHDGNPARVVYVGQGAPVSSRFASHRQDRRIQAYAKTGTLRVTWASVPAAQRDGVERYLADKWNPLVGDAHPDVAPVAVNSPWGQ
jgi:hypothetical protein